MLLALPLTAALAWCPVDVVRDYQIVISYHAVLIPRLGCQGRTRVRLVSALKTGDGKPQLQYPGGEDGKWGWSIEEVPTARLNTFVFRTWEYWDGTVWRKCRLK